MKRDNSFCLLLLVGCIFWLSAYETGCKKNSSMIPGQIATTPRSASFLQKKLQNAVPNHLQAMSAQAKIYAEGEGQSLGATANIVWIRDSVIWVNIKKFGLEAMRALVTQDSVFVLNRLEKTYTAKGLESLQRQYSMPAGFDLLQSVLIASPWYFKDINLEADIKDGHHRLSGANGQFAADYRLEEAAFWLKQEIFIQPRVTRSLSASFDQYKKTPIAGWFPYLRILETSSMDTGDLTLSLEFTEVQFNVPKSIRFEIPKHYERVD